MPKGARPAGRHSATRQADVLIQAGHEGRKTGATGATGPGGHTEISWTPVVANRATHLLRSAGVSVIRENAFLSGTYDVALALFLHFDGSESPCAHGASVGYDDDSDKPAANAWKELYGRYWPFIWDKDNYTKK